MTDTIIVCGVMLLAMMTVNIITKSSDTGKNPWRLKMKNPGFVYTVLKFMDDERLQYDIDWRCEDGEVIFDLNCNDTFWWGTADGEYITEDNFPLLVATYAEFKRDTLDDYKERRWASMLFCCRSRKMRPQNCILREKDLPERIKRLLEACGPERTEKECG